MRWWLAPMVRGVHGRSLWEVAKFYLDVNTDVFTKRHTSPAVEAPANCVPIRFLVRVKS